MYEFFDRDKRVFSLLRQLAALAIALTSPADIELLRSSPVAYTRACLNAWVKKLGGDAIDGTIDYGVAIEEKNAGYRTLEDSPIQPDDALIITAEANRCGYLIAGPALDALEALESGLGVAFYRFLVHSLYRRLHVYDYLDARSLVENMRMMQEEDCEGDQYEVPDVEAAIPVYLREDLLQPVDGKSLLDKYAGSQFCSWIQRLFEIDRLSLLSSTCDMRESIGEYYDQPALPSLLLVFREQDEIEGCFDEEAQTWPEATSEPCFAALFDPADAVKAADALHSLESFIQLNRELVLLIKEINTYTKSLKKK